MLDPLAVLDTHAVTFPIEPDVVGFESDSRCLSPGCDVLRLLKLDGDEVGANEEEEDAFLRGILLFSSGESEELELRGEVK